MVLGLGFEVSGARQRPALVFCAPWERVVRPKGSLRKAAAATKVRHAETSQGARGWRVPPAGLCSAGVLGHVRPMRQLPSGAQFPSRLRVRRLQGAGWPCSDPRRPCGQLELAVGVLVGSTQIPQELRSSRQCHCAGPRQLTSCAIVSSTWLKETAS